MEHETDLELVEQVRNGDRRAYTELMRRHQERVYWVARRITGEHADADDVTQETFVKAYLALGDFRAESGFYTWLYRIAVNLSLNLLRKRQATSYLQQSSALAKLLPSPDRPDTSVELNETEQRLQDAIALLPEKQKAVFVLRFLEGLNYEEISAILKTSVGGLKANYFHALKKIQRMMTDEAPHS